MDSVRVEIGDSAPFFNERGESFQLGQASGVRKTGKPWTIQVAIPCSDGEAYPPGLYRLAASSVYPGRNIRAVGDVFIGTLSFFPRLELVDASNG